MNERGAVILGWVGGSVSAGVVGIVMIAQDVLPITGENIPTTVTAALAAAITGLAATVGWIVRKLVMLIQSGDWVRVDQAEQTKLLARAVIALEKQDEREARMSAWLFDQKIDRRSNDG